MSGSHTTKPGVGVAVWSIGGVAENGVPVRSGRAVPGGGVIGPGVADPGSPVAVTIGIGEAVVAVSRVASAVGESGGVGVGGGDGDGVGEGPKAGFTAAISRPYLRTT